MTRDYPSIQGNLIIEKTKTMTEHDKITYSEQVLAFDFPINIKTIQILSGIYIYTLRNYSKLAYSFEIEYIRPVISRIKLLIIKILSYETSLLFIISFHVACFIQWMYKR